MAAGSCIHRGALHRRCAAAPGGCARRRHGRSNQTDRPALPQIPFAHRERRFGDMKETQSPAMKKLFIPIGLLLTSFTAMGQNMSNDANNFYESDKVIVNKVTFNNQYRMKVVGNLFTPKSSMRTPRLRRSLSVIRWAW